MTNEGVPIPYTSEFAPPTKMGADSVTPLVISLIEAYKGRGPQHITKHGSTVLDAVKSTMTVDGIRGPELDLERVAEVLGDLVTR
jgi:hypothetical protein